MARKKASEVRAIRGKRDRLLRQLPDLRKVLRGTLVERYRRCGRPNCRCARQGDPGHGPVWYLMVTLRPGQTVKVYVPEERREEVQRWIENFRRVRETVEEMSTLNRRLLHAGELLETDGDRERSGGAEPKGRRSARKAVDGRGR